MKVYRLNSNSARKTYKKYNAANLKRTETIAVRWDDYKTLDNGTVGSWYMAPDVYTLIEDTTGSGEQIAPGLLQDTTVLSRMYNLWRFVKIIEVTWTFEWRECQGPGSSVAVDTDARFWWQDKPPISWLTNPDAEATPMARTFLASEAVAKAHDVKWMPIKHHQVWQIKQTPSTVRTIDYTTSTNGLTNLYINKWSAEPWMTINTGQGETCAMLRHYFGGWAISGVPAGDKIYATMDVKLRFKEMKIQDS